VPLAVLLMVCSAYPDAEMTIGCTSAVNPGRTRCR
jgi:hypothetical protein